MMSMRAVIAAAPISVGLETSFAQHLGVVHASERRLGRPEPVHNPTAFSQWAKIALYRHSPKLLQTVW
jgi:hypothetical protein